MLVGIEIFGNLFSQLHQHLEGKAILVGNISELYTPLEYFSEGSIAESLGEVV